MKRIDDIPHDLSFAYSLKAAFEDILGHNTFLKLKECHELKVWKAQSERLLRASLMTFNSTVEVADDTFRQEITDTINSGIKLVKRAETINGLLSCLAGTYARLSFLQFGARLSRKGNPSLRKEDWKLNTYRTVQYVQTETQRKDLEFVLERRRKIQERSEFTEGERPDE